jgi:hypothetical protein
MRRLGISPKAEDILVTERLNVYSGASDPAVSEVPQGQWIVYRNTTSGEVRIWTNIAGSLKKSAAFT